MIDCPRHGRTDEDICLKCRVEELVHSLIMIRNYASAMGQNEAANYADSLLRREPKEHADS